MTPHQYRLYLLSPLMISAGVAGMGVNFMSEDHGPLSRWLRLLWAAEERAKAHPLPERPPAPLLRWTCRPPDADPAWTVEVLTMDHRRRAYRIGGAHYHPVTGRSSRGRATFHGRLWAPRDQEDTLRAWRTLCDQPRLERDRRLHEALTAHRRAVADRLEAIPCERLYYPYGTVRIRQQYTSEWLAGLPEWRRERSRLSQWLCLDDWVLGQCCTMSDETFRQHYRPLDGPPSR